MNFTFGIITDGQNWDRVDKIISSIEEQKIPIYDIIICGPIKGCPYALHTGEPITDNYVGSIKGGFYRSYTISQKMEIIGFDNSPKGWITKKKNLISHISQFRNNENLVLLHDYVSLSEGWYEGMKQFGNDWDVCMTRIENLDGSRFRDWIICDDPEYCHPYNWDAKIAPYEYDKTWWMYVSGAYIITKTEFMRQNPFNENLKWGQGEDVEWSRRVRHRWNYRMNLNSKAKLLKQQELALPFLEAN